MSGKTRHELRGLQESTMTALHNPARIEHEGNQTYGAQTYGAEPRLGLRDLVKVLQRRRSIIIGTVAVTTLASAFLAYYLTPQYTAVSAISIEPRTTRILNTEALIEQIPQDAHDDHDRGEAPRLALVCALRHRSARPAQRSGLQPGAARRDGRGGRGRGRGSAQAGLRGVRGRVHPARCGLGAGFLAGRDRPRAVGDRDRGARSVRAAGCGRGCDRRSARRSHGRAVR